MVASKTYTQDTIQSPFGMVMPGRNWTAATANGYWFGFNGMENDDEIKGENNSYDFGDRIYDNRIGKWLSLDRLQKQYPFQSPYSYCLNTPIQAFDPNGEEVYFVFETTETVMVKEEMPNGDIAMIAQDVKTIHVVNVKDIEEMQSILPEKQWLQEYEDAKKIPEWGDKLSAYENSETEDIYFGFSDIALETNLSGNTKYDAQTEEDGTFTDEGAPLYLYTIFNEVTPKNPTRINHLIVLDKSYLIREGDEANAIGTIVHEVEAHIIYTKDGIPVEEQHNKYYGKKNGSKEDYTDDSPYNKFKIAIQNYLNQKNE